MSASRERYMVAEPALLEAFLRVLSEAEADQVRQGAAQVLLRAADYAPEEGRLVLSVRVVAETQDPPADEGFKSI